MTIREVSRCKAFDGLLLKYAHDSQALGCEMRFNIYLPPCVVANGIDSESAGNRVPLLYFLSGLTCTEDNFMQKAGALPSAAREQLAICTPDTSPRTIHYTLHMYSINIVMFYRWIEYYR
jgi:S-formylglutathione hydrolase